MSQPAPVFNSNHVDEDTVLNRLMSLKANKAIGLDPISASAICSSVASLLNLSISSGKYPDVWKCSKVRPFSVLRFPQFILSAYKYKH